jgi:hypothetical protein
MQTTYNQSAKETILEAATLVDQIKDDSRQSHALDNLFNRQLAANMTKEALETAAKSKYVDKTISMQLTLVDALAKSGNKEDASKILLAAFDKAKNDPNPQSRASAYVKILALQDGDDKIRTAEEALAAIRLLSRDQDRSRLVEAVFTGLTDKTKGLDLAKLHAVVLQEAKSPYSIEEIRFLSNLELRKGMLTESNETAALLTDARMKQEYLTALIAAQIAAGHLADIPKSIEQVTDPSSSVQAWCNLTDANYGAKKPEDAAKTLAQALSALNDFVKKGALQPNQVDILMIRIVESQVKCNMYEDAMSTAQKIQNPSSQVYAFQSITRNTGAPGNLRASALAAIAVSAQKSDQLQLLKDAIANLPAASSKDVLLNAYKNLASDSSARAAYCVQVATVLMTPKPMPKKTPAP